MEKRTIVEAPADPAVQSRLVDPELEIFRASGRHRTRSARWKTDAEKRRQIIKELGTKVE